MKNFVFIGPLNSLAYFCYTSYGVWHLAYWNAPSCQWIYLREMAEPELHGLFALAIPDQEADEKFHSRSRGLRDNFC